jgi:hypothetical protein
MSKLLWSSETMGCGATIQLDSGEVVYVSIAQAGVLVRHWEKNAGFFKSLMSSFFGAKVYNESNVYKNAKTADALLKLFPNEAPGLPNFKNPVLTVFSNAILHCGSAAQVCTVLNEAMSKAPVQPGGVEQQLSHLDSLYDAKIISDYGAFMAETTARPDCFHDANMLPHPKETIIVAIERAIARETVDKRVEQLRTGALFLWNFQEGVGPSPLPLTGVDLSQLPRGTTPADAAELRRILSNPNIARDHELAKHFEAVADAEAKQIERRLTAAEHKRVANS